MTDPPGREPELRSGSDKAPAKGPVKGPAAFRTISEASAAVGVPQHVLRFWETRFAFIRPTKRAGGRRFYRPQDLDVLRGVRVLLQDEGYTIKGVQKLHREQGLKRLLAASGVSEAAASRLAAEVEAEPASQDIDAQGAPAITDMPDAEVEEPDTWDLFGDPPAATDPVRPPPQPEPRLRRAVPLQESASRSVLDTGARARLCDVLSDLEATKAEIDALLQDS